MMVRYNKDIMGNPITKGFYLAGEFHGRRKAGFIFLKMSEKPFEVDTLRGTVEPKGIPIFERNRHYMFPDEWEFIENRNISELNTDDKLREWLDSTWEEWCKKHRRKYEPILGKLKDLQKTVRERKD